MTTEAAVPQGTEDSATPSRALEIVFAAVALAIAAGYLFLGTRIELRQEALPRQIDARFWPIVLGTLAVAVSIALLAIAITRPPAGREDVEKAQPGGVVRVAATCILTLGYVFVWGFSSVVMLGYRIELFPVVTAVFLAFLMLLYGHRRILGLILYPVLVTAFIYVVFGMLLRVPL